MEETEQEMPENENVVVESLEEVNPDVITLDSEDKDATVGEEKSLSENELDKRKNKTCNLRLIILIKVMLLNLKLE